LYPSTARHHIYSIPVHGETSFLTYSAAESLHHSVPMQSKMLFKINIRGLEL